MEVISTSPATKGQNTKPYDKQPENEEIIARLRQKFLRETKAFLEQHLNGEEAPWPSHDVTNWRRGGQTTSKRGRRHIIPFPSQARDNPQRPDAA